MNQCSSGENHGKGAGVCVGPIFDRDSRAQFTYVAVDNFIDDCVVIRDVGPWDKHKTVTNDAEDVVRRVLADYPKTKRL